MKILLSLRSSLITLSAFCALSSCQNTTSKLPIYGEREAVEKFVDGKKIVDTIYHTIPAFKFLNQDSSYITEADFKGKVYIANFFFTHCPSICPTMNRNLLKIYEEYKNNEEVAFLSHSIDFKYDQPYVLKEYANKLGVTNNHWNFVQGSKTDIYNIAINNYLVFAKEDKAAPGGYDHQGFLVLVDKQKRIRGAYDGTVTDQVEKLKKDLAILLQEK